MSRAIRAVWGIAGGILLAGIVAFVVAYGPRSGGDLGGAARTYLRRAGRDPRVVVPLALAAAGVAFAAALGVRRARAVGGGPGGAAVSPLAVADADTTMVVREMLVDLANALKTCIDLAEPDMVGFVDTLLQGAVRVGASDVHLHPLEAGTNVAFRVHGVLEDVCQLPPEQHPRLLMRLKVIGRLVAYRADRPQDGHFTMDTSYGPADVRVSIVPTNHGEKVALRIARAGVELPDPAALGLPDALRRRYVEMLRSPQGVIFLTGPTGSGKTTTIYASLGHIKKARGETTQIATIEDPVEFDVPFLTQTQVNPEAALSFAQGLRSILRQDPNVIMVGEIRDAETAHIAVQAGLTGHLILTTIHAESAVGVFNRLIEMGVEPFLLASASLGCLSQRLVRALCPWCRVRQPASPLEEARRLRAAGVEGGTYFAARGCKRCGGSGYLGRTALFELLVVTPAIRDLIQARVATPRIQEQALADGMTPLFLAGVERANAGATTLREVLRVAG